VYSTSGNDGLSGLASILSSPASGSLFAVGSTNVSVSATDKAGNTTASNFTVTVKSIGINQNGDLGIVGTNGDDVIVATANLGGPATIKINGVSYGPFALAAGKHVAIWGLDGNDTITGVGNMTFEFHGGNGNDN